MSGLTGRIGANLVWLVVFAVGVTVAALLSFASGILFDDTYTVTVPMEEAGGVLPDQEVTLLGRAIGQVADVELTEDGVLLTLDIDNRFPVPRETRVRVLRRSPIGEQAVDFQPVDDRWEAAEPGSRIDPVETQVPAEVPFLLEQTVELFEAIGLEDVTIVFREAADALGGRGETLQALNRSSQDLQRTLVEGIPEFERLIDTSEVVLEVLDEHKHALADSIVNAADLTEVFAEQRPTLEELLDEGTPFLREADAFLQDEQADLACLMDDLIALNEMLLGPSTATAVFPEARYDTKLEELEMAFQKHRFFFQSGYGLVARPDPLTGVYWTRVAFVSPPEGGQRYAEKVATPATLPGAACVTDAFGVGVNAVRQVDPQPPDPTSPGILYAPLVEGASDTDGTSGRGSGGRGATPATGGGAAVAAPLLLGAAWLVRRWWT